MMEELINERNLIAQLRRAFPELEGRYREEVSFFGGEQSPSSYDVFGFVFKPKFIQELEKGEMTDFLRRSANFMEHVCASGDAEAINVVWIKVFEWLIFRRKELKLVWPALGPLTKGKIRDAVQRWTRAQRYFGQTEDLAESNLPSE